MLEKNGKKGKIFRKYTKAWYFYLYLDNKSSKYMWIFNQVNAS